MLFIIMLAVPFAAEKEEKLNYVCLGDSIAAGYGLTGFSEGNFYENTQEYPKESFPFVVSEKLGMEYHSLAMSACRINDLRYLIGGISDEEYDKDTIIFDIENKQEYLDLYGLPDQESYRTLQLVRNPSYNAIVNMRNEKVGNISKAQSIVKNADVITVEIGFNDIFTYPLVKSDFAVAYYLGQEITVEMVVDSINEIYKAYFRISEQFPQLLNDIHNLNAKAKITVVGLFNLSDNLSVIPEGLKIGSALNIVIDSINELYRKTVNEYNKKYGGNAVYVDIIGTENYYDDIDILTYDFYNKAAVFNYIHPNASGAEYIAKQIISTLSNSLTLPKNGKYKITINDKSIGEYTLSSVGNSWYIKNSHGKYLALNTISNTLYESRSPYSWSFENGAFCSYSASSVFSLFRGKTLTPYYIGVNNNGKVAIVTTPQQTTFAK